VKRRPRSSPFTPLLRVTLGLLGAGSFGLGVTAVFVTNNGTGTGVLLAIGAGLLVLALLGNGIESLEFGGAKLRLRAAAAAKFALAEESEQRGDTAAADQLRAEGQALWKAAGPIVADYRSVRGSMSYGPERTAAMMKVVAQARRLAKEKTFDPAEVAGWLQEGREEQRVTALAMMQATSELRDLDAVLGAISDPRSGFEQHEALEVVRKMLDDLDAAELLRVATVIGAQRGHEHILPDTDLWRLSDEILRRVEALSQLG
jgi:hypothetical protein